MSLRIVSLLPSATEIVCALGLRDALVGVSHECDFPADVAGLPVLTSAKLDASRTSGEIDRDVRTLLEQGLGIYRIDVDALRGRVADLAERTSRLPKERVACLEWFTPLMAAGNWVPDLAAAAGATCALAEPGTHSSWLDWQALADDRPDVLCAMPCGFTLSRTVGELRELLREPRWQDIPAVRSGRVFALDGSSYFNRPGPRLAESAEILAGILHPAELGHLVPDGAARRVAGDTGG